MTKNEELLMDGCKLLGMSFEDFLSVYQILLTPEQVLDMIVWLRENIERKPEPMELVIAACEIQEKYKS